MMLPTWYVQATLAGALIAPGLLLAQSVPDPSSEQSLSTRLEVLQVVPEWVRGTWRYTSIVVKEQGFANLGRYRQEELTLPGDLSAFYYTHYDSGERLQRLCWQVNRHTDRFFSFTERLRDQRGAILESTAEITRVAPGRSAIRQRTLVLKAGGWTGTRARGGLFEFADGKSGASHLRTGLMIRDPGTENQPGAGVDLQKLRCT